MARRSLIIGNIKCFALGHRPAINRVTEEVSCLRCRIPLEDYKIEIITGKHGRIITYEKQTS